MTGSALSRQVDGDHYKKGAIQPIEFIHSNGLDFLEGSAVKYIARWRKKGGHADIKKAIHFLELLMELNPEIVRTPSRYPGVDAAPEALMQRGGFFAPGTRPEDMK